MHQVAVRQPDLWPQCWPVAALLFCCCLLLLIISKDKNCTSQSPLLRRLQAGHRPPTLRAFLRAIPCKRWHEFFVHFLRKLEAIQLLQPQIAPMPRSLSVGDAQDLLFAVRKMQVIGNGCLAKLIAKIIFHISLPLKTVHAALKCWFCFRFTRSAVLQEGVLC